MSASAVDAPQRSPHTRPGVSPAGQRRASGRSAGRAFAGRAGRAVALALGLMAVAVGLWEGYKALGRFTGDTVPFTTVALPVSTDDHAMPHVWDIAAALGEPASRGSEQTLLAYYLAETSVTLREALFGLVIGAVVGAGVAMMLREVRFLTRGLMPWLVASQTIPLVALAPIIVVWVGQAGLPSWIAVTIISAYLSFFPITINTLRGLNSPSRVHVELMDSLASSRASTMLRLRLPAAVPSIFTGLRLAATASVVGAVVGELAAGTGRGIGRSILTASYYFSNAPQNLFAAVLVASLAGVLFVQVIQLVEFLLMRNRSH